jgi:8-oxo-dGTP pyrophosphatase MutT (NUDIX family)
MSSTKCQTDPYPTDIDLPAQLAAAVAAPRPRSTRPSRMAPELSYGRHAGPAPLGARAAAVILALFRRHGRWYLPITKRPAALVRHGGQVSLPGGVIEPGETSEQAAVRELREELGFDGPVEILGQLADCYVFATNFIIPPGLAAIRGEPNWHPEPREVEQLVELPIDLLLPLPPGVDGGRASQSISTTILHRGPLSFRAPCYRTGETCIWGATSVILSELAELLASTGI